MYSLSSLVQESSNFWWEAAFISIALATAFNVWASSVSLFDNCENTGWNWFNSVT